MTQPDQTSDSPRGLAFALGAYVLWGFLPLYMKALSHVPTFEVLAHRVMWSVPVAGLLLIWLGRTRDLMTAIRTPRMLAMGCVTAALISMNWGIYVWAIQTGHALDAALGYYINPLFSILLGAVVLREPMNLPQKIAVGLAGVAVVVLTVDAGRLPVLALGMTFTWAAYAYAKKQLPIGPNQGFLLEVLLLLPLALGYAVYAGVTGTAKFMGPDLTDTLLLASAGVVTAVPLILYANGAKLLRLSTIGILQYVSPTLIFLVAVFVFHEPFSTAKMVAFALIWSALAIYTYGMVRHARRPA